MPNWCRNHVSMQGISKYYTKDEDGKTTFSFNTILPMPKELEIQSCSTNDEAIMVYVTEKLTIPYDKVSDESDKYLKHIDCRFIPNNREIVWERCKQLDENQLNERYEEGKILISNIKNYGYPTWYEWANNVWGTKWDAGDVDAKEDKVNFETAWCPPYGVLQKLSELEPDREIICEWWEESGYEGYMILKNGEFVIDEARIFMDDECNPNPCDSLEEAVTEYLTQEYRNTPLKYNLENKGKYVAVTNIDWKEKILDEKKRPPDSVNIPLFWLNLKE